MKYGKLNKGILIQAPPTLTVNDMVHYHPSKETYASFGYMPIIDTAYPEIAEGEEPKYYADSWVEENGQIMKVWAEIEPPELEEPKLTTEDRLVLLENKQNKIEEQLFTTMGAVDALIMGSEG